jgi:hypothetical protein
LTGYDPLVLYPFLVRAGYADHERVAAWLAQRVESLYRTARRGDFDLYLSAEEAADVPKAWRGKPIYKADYGFDPDPVYALPSCYDFYALAYCPPLPDRVGFEAQAEAIVDYLSDPRFQSTIGGYGWNRSKRTCYAGGRGYLACSEPGRLVLFLELGAKFASARNSEWFRQGLAVLESYRTAAHTYRFPADLLMEKPGYYLYGGFHMGLGESRRTPLGLELESTFRMLIIRRRLQR